MNTRRKLTSHEQNSLVTRLEELLSSIEESYAYPLDDLIDNLKNPKQREKNEVEEDNGVALMYYLHFSSPDETWALECGCAGIYTVDAGSLKAVDFNLTRMN
jgi:hypothetical protein